MFRSISFFRCVLGCFPCTTCMQIAHIIIGQSPELVLSIPALSLSMMATKGSCSNRKKQPMFNEVGTPRLVENWDCVV